MIELAQNSMGAHISQFQPGTYKKAHRHGPGAHVIILDGVLDQERAEPILRRIDQGPPSI